MNFYRLISFLLLSFYSFVSHAEIINNIEINGLEKISRGAVLNYLLFEVGDDVSENLLKDSIKALDDTKFFSKISISINENQAIINLIENPTIKYVDFINYEDGNVLDETGINDLLLNNNLNTGNIYSKSNLDNLINSLQVIYQENAFYNSNIKINSEIDSQNRIGVVLDFSEGDRALISSMEVSGNELFSSDEILDLFEIGEPDFFILNYFTEKDRFSKNKYEAGLESVINKYSNAGYLDVSIKKSKVTFNAKTNQINVNVVIDEGSQYKLDQIQIDGDLLNYSIENLKSYFPIESGDSFQREKILKGVNAISRLYQDIGYAYVSVKLRAEPSSNNPSSLNAIIVINPNSLIYVNRIIINGNNTTKDEVIRRELQLLEGQTYSKDYLLNSISRIKRLGYFSSVDYKFNRLKKSPDKIDLILNLVETKTGEFSIGLSHSNSTGASLNTSVSQKNIFGTGNTFNASLSNSDAVKETSFYFKNPHFNNFGHSISYGYFNKELNATNLEASAYVMNEAGYKFGYGIPTSADSNIFAEFKVSDIELSCGAYLLVDEQSSCSNPNKNDFTSAISFSHNSLNDYIFPSNGKKYSLLNIFALPISSVNYFKFESSYSSYSPVFTGNTFKLSSRFKYADGYGGDNLPFYERYFEGGGSSVRGFDFNSLGTKYASSGMPKGGEISLVTSAGISSSLKSVGVDNPNMKFISFVDAGILSETVSDFDPGEIRSSVGVGLNWFTPVGPIGLNYAYPIKKKSDDDLKTFSFQLGTSF